MNNDTMTTSSAIEASFSFASSLFDLGCLLSIVASYVANHHFGWAILHGATSWGYVLYRALGYGA